MRKILDDLFILAGGILIMVGLYFTYPVLIFFVGGALLIGLGILLGVGNRTEPIERDE